MTTLAVFAVLTALIVGVPYVASLPTPIALPIALALAVALVVIERRLARGDR